MRYGYETSNLGSYDLLKDFARQNRAEATEAEEILWRRLRGKKLGYRFRRQHPIDCYIVDFVCLELKLVVEVDGGYHETQNQQVEDQERTRILNESGYTVIRFSNEDVLQNERDVINQIALAMKRQERLNADHAPSLGGGRGRFLLILLLFFSLSALAKHQGKELTDLLFSYMQLEEVHPDSMERNIADLKETRSRSRDAAERAVYAAAIARLYGERMYWRSVGTNFRDSMVAWYGLSLADKQVLAQTKAKRWKPFVVVGKDEGYFGGDMLNVVWRSMTNQVDKRVRDASQVLPKAGEMVDFYQSIGRREAALLLALDSLDASGTEARREGLLRLRNDYADVPLCAEVYLRLGTMATDQPRWREVSNSEIDDANQSARRCRDWLQEGLRKYPKYKRKAALQNALTRLSDPFLEKDFPTCVSPDKQYWWRFRVRNVQSVVIDGKEHVFPKHDPVDTFTDSILWTSPKVGRYKYTLVPRTKAKLTEKIKPLEHHVNVTTLQDIFQLMPDSSFRVLVVDPETGRPQPNVDVRVYKPTSDWKDTVCYFAGRTGQDGKLWVPKYTGIRKNPRWNTQLMYKVCSPDTADWILAHHYFYGIGRWTGKPTKPDLRTKLFTDRAIYRPGQTVHVSGLSYSQLDWDAETAGEGKHTLKFYDSNHKLLEERVVNASDMGVFSADFVIPTGGRNGTFSIEADKRERAYFRVEEYKRPTFEVQFDDSLYVMGDSCEVRGSATNYDGSPLRSARVTGNYHWRRPWIHYGKRLPQSEDLPLDTIETDDRGRFVYKLRIKSEESGIDARRQLLSVSVDVLSQQGETHSAQHWYWRVAEPKPTPQPVKVDSTFLIRCVADTFALDKPGRIEVTTKLHDVYLFYILSAAGKIWKDEMVRLDNETFVLDIPYREEYDQSLTASFCFVKEARIYKDTKTIYLMQPDNRLRVHWDTFRDLVQPGQQEEWRLTLRRPDGKPADANLMVAMYDASLDYFVRHQWHFDIGRGHRTFGVPFEAGQRISLGTLSSGGWYNQKTKKERPLSFTNVNAELFQVMAYTRDMGRGPIMHKAAVNTMKMASAAPKAAMTEKSALEGAAPVNRPVMREVVVESEADEGAEDETAETISVPMRENFQETAFFMPQLRTDKNGQVAIAFTLPESLTRWNLMGVAHTADMMYANLSESIEARKDLMAQLYLPRFLRPGDEAVLTASVRNVTDQRQQGSGVMQILDAKTEKVVKQWKTTFDLQAQRDTVLHFPCSTGLLPDADALIIRWAVKGTTCSDGEQRLLPVLPATMHVTNTIAITAYDSSVQHIDLSTLFPAGVTDKRLTVEYTTHPEQYALQALPALARAKSSDVLSLSAAYYAGVLANVLNAKIADSTEVYLDRIKALQDADGGFRWYPQMPVSPYLTREVSFLLTRLHMLTDRQYAADVNTRAVRYLLSQRIDSTYLSTADLRTLYIAQYSGVQLTKEEQRKVDFLLKLAKREDVEEDGYERQALLAIVLKKAGADRKARKCAGEFRRYLVSNPQRGTYIEFPKGSFTSINRKLHIHVQMMEALWRLNPQDTMLLGMRRYLLQQKRTQEWTTPVNSANAIFALLSDKLSDKPKEPAAGAKMKDQLTLTRKGSPMRNFTARDDTLGYIRDSLDIEDGKMPLRLRLHKFSKGESWGGVYADFSQRFDEVGAHAEGLSIRQEYPTEAKSGNRYTVCYYISADRDYEYVTLICPRPAFTEPVNQRSGYGWSGGLGYYRQVHDATTEFNFHRIPRGDYLIEETLYVERDGRYHSGVAVIRCEYADEFQGHSDDAVVEVSKAIVR